MRLKPAWLVPFTVIATLTILFLIAKARYVGSASAASGCDSGLWKHVYRPKRLRILKECAELRGRVVAVQRDSDGDVHISVDPDDAAVLNLVNLLHNRGLVPVEAICEHEPEQGEAKPACAGFTLQLALPVVGDRIRVLGAYVTDRENGWNEIHPITRLERLR